jgi:predicted patatin/cPLA2 family phospholipase
MEDINKLVICGGAANVYYILGGLDILYDKGKLKNINSYCGTSIGALVGVLLNINWSPRKIADTLSDITSTGAEWGYSQLLNIIINFSKGSIIDIKPYEDFIDLLFEKENITTMIDLYNKTGKEMIISTSNLDTYLPEYISYKTDPKIPVKDALLMSMAIPFCFETRKYNGQLYCDGGILGGFPMDNNENILGIWLMDCDSKNLLHKILIAFFRKTYNNIINKDKIIVINKDNNNVFLKADIQQQLSMFNSGQNQVLQQLVDIFKDC